ncbi:hypothetical protein [Chroococcidiopsis sp.]|uniref:hypothetical protein n=1 Tax=Chroococcidiopsis sp. TaxID=3088168 RepID=UPI003F6640CE
MPTTKEKSGTAIAVPVYGWLPLEAKTSTRFECLNIGDWFTWDQKTETPYIYQKIGLCEYMLLDDDPSMKATCAPVEPVILLATAAAKLKRPGY